MCPSGQPQNYLPSMFHVKGAFAAPTGSVAGCQPSTVDTRSSLPLCVCLHVTCYAHTATYRQAVQQFSQLSILD